MSHSTNANTLSDPLEQPIPENMQSIFARLNPEDVEQFYKSYQLWTLQRQIETYLQQIETLRQEIEQNTLQMNQISPSPIAFSTLAQFQASGVEDIDLLDNMLDRGEAWLDHTMQQLEQCERLDLIGGDYTQWCKHALEGAYNWIDSMDEADMSPMSSQTTTDDHDSLNSTTEALFLQKLMSDSDKKPITRPLPRITAPLPSLEDDTLLALPIVVEVAITPIDDMALIEAVIEPEAASIPIEDDVTPQVIDIVPETIIQPDTTTFISTQESTLAVDELAVQETSEDISIAQDSEIEEVTVKQTIPPIEQAPSQEGETKPEEEIPATATAEEEPPTVETQAEPITATASPASLEDTIGRIAEADDDALPPVDESAQQWQKLIFRRALHTNAQTSIQSSEERAPQKVKRGFFWRMLAIFWRQS